MILLLTIFLVVGLFVHDIYLQGVSPEMTPAVVVSWIVPPLALAAVHLFACRVLLKRLKKREGKSNLQSLERITHVYLIATAAIYAWDLCTGLLLYVRSVIGDRVLIDELVVMSIPIAMICWSWWAVYPIDRHRKRIAKVETALAPDIAPAGVYTPPTRIQFVIYHLRLQLAIVLVPLLFMVGLQESLGFLHDAYPLRFTPIVFTCLHFLGIGVVLLFAPVVLRYIWDTAPLPPGDLRDRLLELCKSHRVGVRQLLVWKTYGAMINGAVMGLISPLRFILLTDSLIDRLPQAQIEAVMAHELAHVKRGHIIWLFLTTARTLSMLSLLATTVDWFFFADAAAVPHAETPLEAAVDVLSTIIVMGAWWGIFGWVSRRFERQADTFAVQHSAMKDSGANVPVVITDNAARTMIDALESVALLNNMSPKEAVWKQWRHGSIRWRQLHLFALVGRRTDQLPIDRTVRRIKFTTAAVLLVLIMSSARDYWNDAPPHKTHGQNKQPAQAVGAGADPVAKPDASPIMKAASQL